MRAYYSHLICMSFVVIAFLLVLLLITVLARFALKTVCSPAHILNVSWLVAALLVVCGSAFYGYIEVYRASLLIIILGLLSFNLGYIGAFAALKNRPFADTPVFRPVGQWKALFVIAILMSAYSPIAWRDFVQLAGGSNDISEMIFLVRYNTVANGEKLPWLTNQLVTVASCLFPIATLAYAKRRVGVAILVWFFVLALFYATLSATRAGIVPSFISAAFVFAFVRRINLVDAFKMGAVFLLLNSIFVLGTNKIDTDDGNIISGVVGSIVSYATSGIYAFDVAVNNPDAVPPMWDIASFFYLVANALGFKVASLGAGNLAFTNIGPEVTNVYTAFFAVFPHYGYVGVALAWAAMGAIMAFLYKRAMNGSEFMLLLCARLVCSLPLSVFSDAFYSGLYGHISFVLVVSGVAALSRFFEGKRRTVHRLRIAYKERQF